MKYYVISVLICSVFFVNCQKDDTPPEPTKTELISSAAWKYDNGSLDVDKNGVSDTPLPPGLLQACDTDNLLLFKSDGTGTVDEGATKCNAANPQIVPFTWAFNGNESVVTFSNSIFSGFGGDVTIKTLSQTKLELHKEVGIGLPQTVNVIINMKH